MKRKMIVFLLLFTLIGGTLTGCSQFLGTTTLKLINDSKKIDTKLHLKKNELDADYVTGLNQFAYNIFNKLVDGENVFISPYSINLALSMLYNGAEGETRTEMAKLFGYDLLPAYTAYYNGESNNIMNSNGKLLMDSLQKADPKATLEVANSIWISKDFIFEDTIESALLAPVRAYYDGDIFQSDFLKEETLDQINKWTSDKTDGMIDPLLNSLSEDLVLLLVNAIYFNGEWTEPFKPENTRKDRFYGTETTSQVDMMYMFGDEYRYLSENDMKGIELPYGNGRLVMDILIPNDTSDQTINESYSDLTSEEIESFLKKLDSTTKSKITNLALPKFDMEYGMVELNKALQELGMKSAFQENADFSLIGKDLYVSLVGHTAKIEVEEWGTKAAAATVATVETTSAVIEEPLNFIVNEPFIFFIRDTQTGAIIFMGEINNLDD